jgi:hypothetical protein
VHAAALGAPAATAASAEQKPPAPEGLRTAQHSTAQHSTPVRDATAAINACCSVKKPF